MRQAVETLVKLYSSDMGDTPGNELIQFGGLVAELSPVIIEHDVSSEATMYRMLIKRNLSDVFPKVEVLLRIYLTFNITNCSVDVDGCPRGVGEDGRRHM